MIDLKHLARLLRGSPTNPPARIFLTRAEAADILAVSPSWLKKGNGPRATKLGPRTIRYHRADVEAYAEAQRAGPKNLLDRARPTLTTVSQRERQIIERL